MTFDEFMDIFKFKFESNKPEIKMAIGFVCLGASFVACAKQSMKVPDILDGSKKVMDVIHEKEEEGDPSFDKAIKKGKVAVAAQTALSLGKIYAVPFGLFLTGTSAIVSSHLELKTNLAVTAAALAENIRRTGFYRRGVVNRLGEEFDRNLWHGVETEEYEETVTDAKGNEKQKKKKRKVANAPGQHSAFSVLWSDGTHGGVGSRAFTGDKLIDKATIINVQNYMNDKLKARAKMDGDGIGWVTLEEVKDALEFNMTKAERKIAREVGWRYDENDPTRFGDGYIDFNLAEVNIRNMDTVDPETGEVIVCYEENFWLDFNIDGNILVDFDEV